MGESYDGRASVPSISREGVTQKSCRVTATQSIIKVTEQSACFGRGGVTAFTERRVTGVLPRYSPNRNWVTVKTHLRRSDQNVIRTFSYYYFGRRSGYVVQTFT